MFVFSSNKYTSASLLLIFFLVNWQYFSTSELDKKLTKHPLYWRGYFHFNSVWWATPRGFLCCPLWAGPPRRWGWGGPNRASSCPRTRWPWCWCYRSPRAIPSATGGAPGPRHLFWPVNRLRILFTKRNFSHTSMHGCRIIF